MLQKAFVPDCIAFNALIGACDAESATELSSPTHIAKLVGARGSAKGIALGGHPAAQASLHTPFRRAVQLPPSFFRRGAKCARVDACAASPCRPLAEAQAPGMRNPALSTVT